MIIVSWNDEWLSFAAARIPENEDAEKVFRNHVKERLCQLLFINEEEAEELLCKAEKGEEGSLIISRADIPQPSATIYFGDGNSENIGLVDMEDEEEWE